MFFMYQRKTLCYYCAVMKRNDLWCLIVMWPVAKWGSQYLPLI